MDFSHLRAFIEYSELQDAALNRSIKPDFERHRSEGVQISQSGAEAKELQYALRCFDKALVKASKNEYAKASVYHDIGVFYFTHFAKLSGGPLANLKKSITYLTRAIEKKQRQRFPDKYAASLSQLGAVYRRAANEPLFQLDKPECLRKSCQLHRRALSVLEAHIPLFVRLNQSCIIYFNLAAALFDTEDKEEGCNMQEMAFNTYIEAIKWAESNLPQSGLQDFISLKPEKIFGLTFSRLSHFSQNEQHKELCKYMVSISSQFGLDPLEWMRINPYADISDPSTEIRVLVDKANQDRSFENIDRLSRRLHELMANRQSTDTDQATDRVSVLIQQASSGLARILVKEQQFLQAFVTLENTSGMRFCENARSFWYYSEDPLVQVLVETQLKVGSVYYGLNELMLMAEHVGSNELYQWLADSAQKLMLQDIEVQTAFDEQIFEESRYAYIVDAASRASDPVRYLNEQAQLCLADFKKLGEVLDKKDFDYHQARLRTSQITVDDVTEAVNAHPDQVLVKIDIENYYDDALVVVLYRETADIIANAYSVKLPQNLVNDIGAVVNNKEPANRNWVLDFIDWKRILPQHLSKVSLLPSFFASHIPWTATGKEGEKLYQLVEEVNWLPSLMYLYETVKYFDQKTQILKVCGGNTQFEQLAANGHIDIDYAQSKQTVIAQLKRANVFSFYGHCEHKHPDRPSLLFKDDVLKDVEMRTQVRGAERIELWACQSGSSIPLHFLPSQVNEAFGMDMRMLEYGAKTAMGSLWAVPELVTAHIKVKYDNLMEAGYGPSAALLQAQRWWIDSGADEELAKIKTLGENQYLNDLGCNYAKKQAIQALMGPVLAKDVKPSEVNEHRLKDAFKHPTAWAGMRFCGVSKQQAIYIPRERLSAAQKQQLHNLIAKMKLRSGFVKNAG